MLFTLWKRYGSDLLWIAAIVCCGLKFTQHIPEIIDYPISDEGSYLQDGLDIPANGVKPLYWGSLYNVWYYIGSLLIPNKIALFYAHVKFITVGLPFLFYILLRQIGRSSVVSFSAAFLYLISFGNLFVFHKGNHTALFLMLLIIVCGYRWHKMIHFWLLIAISILLSAFIRPELFIAFYLAIAWYIYLLLKSNLSQPKKYLIIGILLFSSFYFSRIMFADQDRSLYTFRQNFSMNWVNWNNLAIDPDQNNEMLFHQAFGDAKSISQAFKCNPGLFIKHLVWNIKNFGQNYIKLGVTHFNIFLPDTKRTYTLLEGLLTMLIIALTAFMANRKTQKITNSIKANRRWLWLSFFLFIPSMITNILFYPRFNFIVLPLFLTYMIIPIVFFQTVRFDFSKLKIGIIILFLYLITPSPSFGNNWYFSPAGRGNLNKTPIKLCVEKIESLPLKHACVSFIAEKAIYQYSTRLINGVSIYHDGISIQDFIGQNRLELLVVSKTLLSNNIVNGIVGFHNFISHPELLNFRKVEIANSDVYLLVSEEALRE